MKKHQMRRWLVVVAAASTALVLSAVPAHAQEGSGGSYYTPPTPYSDSGDFDPGCENLDLTVHYEVSGVYSERNVPGSGGQAFLFKDSSHFQEVWRESSSGEVLLRIRGAYVFEETSAEKVPKSQVPPAVIPEEGLIGPVYLFTATETGSDVVRDSDGNVLYRTAGVLVFKNLFDTLGDSMPGGTSLASDIVRVVGPHPLLDVDLCDVAEEQIV